MKQLKYDIVIIGSGVGGLTASALLTKAGYKTLVVEKLPFAGGRCATLDYHGYKVDTGVAVVIDQIHGELCREVGAEFELRTVKPLSYYRVKGKDYPVPSPGIMKTMITDACGNAEEAIKLLQAYKRSLTWAEPSYSMSLYDWLQQYTANPTVAGIFQTMVAILVGMRPSEIPAGEFFCNQKTMAFKQTVGFLPHGGGYFTEALVNGINRMGGEVWTCCPAQQIKVNDEMTTSIVVNKNGEEFDIEAKAVISNAVPHRTVDMSGKKHFSPGYLKDVAAVNSVPMLRIMVSSDRPLVEGASMLAFPECRRLFFAMGYSNICPEVAPKGKHLFVGFSFTTSYLPPYDFKKEIELSIQDLRDTIPSFDKHAQILRIDTFHGDWGEIGIQAGYNLPVKTPVEGLYQVGDFAGPKGWWASPAAIKSARMVVEDIIQRYKPT